jgi:SAM-dependent methyltransferase
MSETYWDNQFKNRFSAHSEQNDTISLDFIKSLKETFTKRLVKAKSIIEIGCGTGELLNHIYFRFNKNLTGTDLSLEAINFAKENYKNIEFKQLNVLEQEVGRVYDLAICSNVLEHFKDPYVLINKILTFANYLICLVPYKQPVTDGYDYEGGPGHVFMFDEDSFSNYKILDSFLFTTNGWQHSSSGEEPKQLAILIEKK